MRYQVGRPIPVFNERFLMVSDKLREVLDVLENRERAADFETPMDRLKADLQELEEADIINLTTYMMMAATVVSEGDPYAYATSIFTIGLELGRELERRV